jgi:ABC-type Fe3+-siderophore transport system permease subunit
MMPLIIILGIAIVVSIFLLIELVRNFLFKNNKNGIIAGVVSLLALGFGAFLWIKHGLILDYGSQEDINKNHSVLMGQIGMVLLSLSSLFILLSVIYYFFKKVVNNK